MTSERAAQIETILWDHDQRKPTGIGKVAMKRKDLIEFLVMDPVKLRELSDETGISVDELKEASDEYFSVAAGIA